MRVSMWLWRSFAAWNSAFSEMSPWARAASISRTIFGRSTPVELDFLQVEKI